MRNAKAIIRMEELYEDMIIEYSNLDFKEKIYQKLDEAKEKFKITPMVIEKDITDEAGNITIEFNGEYESDARDAGEFFEFLVKELGLEVS